MRQRKRWISPKLIIIVRDSRIGVLVGCKSNGAVGGPASSSCMVHINCCSGDGCSVYPGVPDCAIGCKSGPCPPGFYDDYNGQQLYCDCADAAARAGDDCTVAGYCFCRTLAAS